MQSQPHDLTDDAVATAVSEGWDVPATAASYLPVGYGSHHWAVEDAGGGLWFASVDVVPLDDRDGGVFRLTAALGVAVAARDSGLSFVVAPPAYARWGTPSPTTRGVRDRAVSVREWPRRGFRR